MQIKQYQQETLDALQRWCDALVQTRLQANTVQEVLNNSQKTNANKVAAPSAMEAALQKHPLLAWEDLRNQKLIPPVIERGKKKYPPYISRTAANGQPIPHVCLKVPTGGGKTFLGVQALQHLKQSTGFVLWVVPTKSIYEQTLTAFRTREHPYRQVLENLSNYRLKILEKNDHFTRHDVENNLCLMILTLSSTNRRKSKEFLKMFRDGSQYTSFFPEVDDVINNQKLMQQHPDLEKNDQGTWVLQSLFNVFKLLRPTVILDEAHKAYGKNDDKKIEFVNSVNRLNPRFVLELSATPQAGISNILVNITGLELKDEQMIKLPIEVHNFTNSNWQHTLAETQNKLNELEQQALQAQHKERTYIRPIAVVRVEQTGKKQIDKGRIHAEDAKKYLITNLGVPPEQVCIQSSEQKELAGVDLKSDTCPVRWIITKDALKEGWDCSFAYVLALLDNTKALTAITQMAGRVMRQPYAQYLKTSEALNRCYIYCFNNKVKTTVEQVKQCLEAEGLSGLSGFVQTHDGGGVDRKSITTRRRKAYAKQAIFLPQVLHKKTSSSGARGSKGVAKFMLIDYDRHILGQLDWQKLSCGKYVDINSTQVAQEIKVVYDLKGTAKVQKQDVLAASSLDVDYFIRRLLDVVPNPWQAARLVEQFIQLYKKQDGASKNLDDKLMQNKTYLSECLRQHIKTDIDAQAEALFRQKVANGDIRFHLEANLGFDKVNASTKNNRNLLVEPPLTQRPTHRKPRGSSQASPAAPVSWRWSSRPSHAGRNATASMAVPISRNRRRKPTKARAHLSRLSIGGPLCQGQPDNHIINNTAIYLEQSNALHWWHRIAARQDYALQGWRRHRVYPDFLAYRGDTNRLMIVELKGTHLKGNTDTEYKENLLERLEKIYKSAHERGQMQLHDPDINLSMIFENDDLWQGDLDKMLHQADN